MPRFSHRHEDIKIDTSDNQIGVVQREYDVSEEHIAYIFRVEE
jgi:hypothetical protein